MAENSHTRRRLLRLGGITLTALAGCGGDDGGSTTSTSEETPTATRTTTSPEETPTQTSTDSPSDGGEESVRETGATGSWPTLQSDPGRSGVSASEQGPTGSATPYWRFQMGSVFRRSSPVVADGTVYVLTMDATIYAVSANDATEQWHRQLDQEDGLACKGAPAVVDGTVYVPSGSRMLYALDAADGSEEWQYEVPNAEQESFNRSRPAVVDGTVYTMSGTGTHAVSADGGTEVWANHGVETNSTGIAVADGTFYYGIYDTTLAARATADGTPRWSFGMEGLPWTTPTVASGTVYAGDDSGRLYALSADSGREQWRTTLGNKISASPAVADGTVYVGTANLTGPPSRVYALSTADGSEQWRFEPDNDYSFVSPPVVAGDTLYVSDSVGALYALSTADGTVRWRHRGSGNWSAPAVVDGTVFATNRNYLYAFGEA